MGKQANPTFNTGSHWHRWDPHIHTPETLRNDQFKGADPWNDYLTKLEEAKPIIKAIGVTDYCSLTSYERVIQEKSRGRLPNVSLIFPNIEMRLVTATVKSNAVNIHLLISPEDPTHLAEARKFLSRLTFEAHGERFACSHDDLIKLGQKIESTLQGRSALSKGVDQFKVGLDNLRDEYRASNWAKQNILIAVSGTETDGTSGVRQDQYQTVREEIEKFAHVIFASSATQRNFWLGDGPASITELYERFDGPKPCIHGCDAHDLTKVGVPDGDRFTWIKGEVTFDTLRQALIDPRGRAFVGPTPPISTIPSQAIASIELSGAEWAKTPNIAFNPGLVAIIGSRGSGKTALAEMMALGCDSIPENPSEASFLRRAAELLPGVASTLVWESGERTRREPLGASADKPESYPRARYLSQQFVEELCAADHMTDRLLEEIQRVVFEAHPLSTRDGASNFEELLHLRVDVIREARVNQQTALAELSERIGIDREKETSVPALRTLIEQKKKLLLRYKEDRGKLVTKGSQERVNRLDELAQAAEKVRGYLRYYANQKQGLLSLTQDVVDHRTRRAPETLRQSKIRFQSTGLKDADWERFLLQFKGNVEEAIAALQSENEADSKYWKGSPPTGDLDPNIALIGDEAKLEEQPLSLLEAEIARLQKFVNIDKDTANKFAAISKRIDEETTAVANLTEKLKDCEGAAERIKSAQQERELCYESVFKTIVEEQKVLNEIYAPLRDRLSRRQGTAKKLSFTVKRIVDVASWSKEGESLLDKRVSGPFKGRGTLQLWAEELLKPFWEKGDPAQVSAVMAQFFAKHREDLLGSNSVPPTAQANHRDWLKRFAKWLYSTKHISIAYGIDYDGTDIRKLSPGTRGIVLLILFLALDEADDRPLIVDQPEENLDPKSIYDELIPLFREAKSRRQVVLVTHNANLVVITDADQVIVAEAGAHAPGQLPPITYTSGGLDTAEIRRIVCDILEGGEEAFRERARRLRVQLQR